jgi:hypothetical protein
VAFIMGVLDAFADHGLDAGRGPLLGSSAGAWAAAARVTGVGFEEIMEAWEAHQWNRPIRVIDITRPLFGDRRDARVTGIALQAPFMRRVQVSGAVHPLADVVAASSSPPRMAKPHRIGVYRYVDSVARFTSADRSPGARLHVVVTPLGGKVLGRLGWFAERTTRYEMTRWQIRHGGAQLFVRPTRAIARLVDDTEALFRIGMARETYPMAYELGVRCLERFRDRHPDLAEEFLTDG